MEPIIAFAEAERYAMQLTNQTSFDFYGLAHFERKSRRLRWIWSFGSISGKTMQLHHRASIGLTGASLRARRMVVLDANHAKSEHLRSEEPIILSEGLQTAAAAWFGTLQDEEGILLVGRREAVPFTEDELRSVQCNAKKISGALQAIICQH